MKHAIFPEFEVFFLEIGHDLAAFRFYGRVDENQIHADANNALCGLLGASGEWDNKDGPSKQAQEQVVRQKSGHGHDSILCEGSCDLQQSGMLREGAAMHDAQSVGNELS